MICCDNLPHNGRTVEGIVDRVRAGARPGARRWIGAHVAFPCTMVDRIVPATTDADIAEAGAAARRRRRRAGGRASRTTSWVIENRFAAARPAWEDAGAQIVADVAPFETMKLRLSERQPLDARLPRLPRRARVHLAGVGRPAARGADRAADDGRDPADAQGPAGRRPRRVLRRARRALPQSRAAAPDAADRDGRLAEAPAAAARHRARPARAAAGRSPISRSRSPDGSATRAARTSTGKPIAVADPLAAKFAAIASAAARQRVRCRRRLPRSRAVFGADLSGNARVPRGRWPRRRRTVSRRRPPDARRPPPHSVPPER